MFDINLATTPDSIVILVSFDGFRYDYIDKYRDSLPTLRTLAKNGVRADYVQNVFPTETFPNHYTIVTGLYPEHHGIVSNNMYDPVFNASFSLKTNDSRWWQWGEPIWVTTEKQHKKSGVCYWPGYDAVIKGYQPTYRPMNTSFKQPFVYSDHIMPWKDRIDMAVKWLNSTEPPSTVLLYFNEPDEQGHMFGTESQQVKHVLKELDGNTSYLMQQLHKLDCYDRINFIFTSDHGMIDYNISMFVNIDQYVDPESYIIWGKSPLRLLCTNSSKSTLEDLYHNLKIAENKTHAFTVYKKDELPDYFHYRHNRRIPDIIVVLKVYHLLNTTKVHYTKTLLRNETHGAHGYSASLKQMHQYLVAYGPAFKQGYRSGPVYEVDLYSLMCHILGIVPAKNDGDFNRISHILKSSNWFMHTIKSQKTVALAIACITVAAFIITIVVIIIKKCRSKDNVGGVYFSNKRKENVEMPLIGTDDEDDLVVM